MRDRVRFKDHVNYYDIRNHESNFEKVQSIKMKRFYGLHNPKYMGETVPVLQSDLSMKHAPLRLYGFKTVSDGFNTKPDQKRAKSTLNGYDKSPKFEREAPLATTHMNNLTQNNLNLTQDLKKL